ncbi:hypothetical protein JCM11491_005316 [Sporobolomyces phaffii]
MSNLARRASRLSPTGIHPFRAPRYGLASSRSSSSSSSSSPASPSFTSSPNRTWSEPPIFHADNVDVYPFGVPSDDPARAWFRSLTWTISSSPRESWAILSPSAASTETRSHLVSTVLHHARFSPPTAAGHPILATLPPVERPAAEGGPRDRTVEDLIEVVSFKTRLSASGGGFQDHTARYYSIRDEDKLTTREHLRGAGTAPSSDGDGEIERLARLLKVEQLLDLPLITLSNGQTRRARILRALLKKPELVVLEEPFTGLDVASRESLVELLGFLHSTRSPRVLLVLRPQDSLPPFVSHLALVDDSTASRVTFGSKDEVLSTIAGKKLLLQGEAEREVARNRKALRQTGHGRRKEEDEEDGSAARRKLIQLENVQVVYGRPDLTAGARTVLNDITWTIREGEKWVLAGHNGSGKSTLLSIILGDHPKSFTESVTLFDKPRYSQATSTIQREIGHVSPEVFNAFPRKYGEQGLTAFDAIVTGFESIYSYRRPTREQAARVRELVAQVAHPAVTDAFLARTFAALTPGEQSLVLLLRAVVNKPRVVVLDEPFQGMDRDTVACVQRFLTSGLVASQSVVLVSHFEEEIPPAFDRRIELEHGRVSLVL